MEPNTPRRMTRDSTMHTTMAAPVAMPTTLNSWAALRRALSPS